MKTQTTASARNLIRTATAALGLALPVVASAVSYTKAGTGTDLTDLNSWATSVVPGSSDIATWSGTSLGAGLTIGSNLSWQGIAITGALGNIDITGAGTLTLGTSGIDMTGSTVNTSIANAIALGGAQTWKVAGGQSLSVSGVVSGTGGLTIDSTLKTLTSTTFLTGTAAAIFTNTSLLNIVDADGKMGGAYVNNGTAIAANGYQLQVSGTSPRSYWLKIVDGGFTKGVKVELAQSGNDITARAISAKYISGSNLAYDFDAGGNAGTVATTQAGAGYGAAETYLGQTGTVTLSGLNTFTGGITVNAGILDLATTGMAFDTATGNGGGAITVNAGGVLRISQAFNTGYSRAITINGGTMHTLSGVDNYSNNITLQNGAYISGNAPRLGYHSNATITVSGSSASFITSGLTLVKGSMTSATLDVADVTSSTATDLTVSGVIADLSGYGGLRLVKNSGGTLVLSAANTFSGGVTVNGGILRMGNKNAFGAFQTGRPVSQVTVNSGGAIDFNGVLDATYGYTIAGTGVGGTGALTNTGGTIGGGTAQTTNITLANNASIGGTGAWALLAGGHGATNLNLGSYTLTKTGANTISFVSTTTTAGTVQVSAGGLAFGVSEGGTGVAGAASAFILDNTTGVSLTVNRASSIGSLAGGGVNGGNVALGANTLTVGALNTDTSYDGVISGASGALTKTGTGKLTLTGANTYTGATTVNGGTLVVNGNQAAATGAVTVNNAGSKLAGTGTVGGATTINSGAIHAVGGAAGSVGSQTFSSDLSYASGSIFEWDINANADADGAGIDDGTAGTDFDKVTVTGNLGGTSGAIFRVVFGATAKAGIEDGGNAFWNTPSSTQIWNMATLFGKAFTSGQFTAVQTYDSNGVYDVSAKGSFTINGTSLTWTAVPEPTSAIAGLLLGAGLLRRRRNS